VENLLKTLLNNYLEVSPGILGASIFDRDGLVIASESKGRSGDESVMGALSAVVDSYIERIKSEFGSQSSFCNITTIEGKKFSYCAQGPNAILTTVADPSATDTELRIYSEHIAAKIEQLIDGNEAVDLGIPEIIKVIENSQRESSH